MGSRQVVGIDIGHQSIKVVGLQLGKKPVLIGCKEVALDAQYLQKEGFTDPELVAKAVREAMSTAAPKPIPPKALAYATVSESQVFRKVLELPALKDEGELLEAIKLEASQYLPDSSQNMELDYQVISPTGDGTAQQVMVVALNKRIVREQIAVFSAAKLTLKAIEVKPESIGRALVKPGEKEAFLLVDIGSEMSTVCLYDSGAIRVTGSLNMGGNIIRDESGEIDEEKRQASLKRLAEGLADEIDHVTKFYMNRTLNQHTIKEIRLSGGGSMIAEIPKELEGLVDMPVKAGKGVLELPPFCDRRFLGALGCALYSQERAV